MESHSYENDRGEGGIEPVSGTPTPETQTHDTQSAPQITCEHLNRRGRRCRSGPLDNSAFCRRHQPDPKPTADELAAELLGSIPDFSTASSVNLFLGNLVKQFAHKRIERRDAVTLAYLGQLLLNSLPALDRQYKVEEKAPTIIFDMPEPDTSSYPPVSSQIAGRLPNPRNLEDRPA
jgi:hypothetical protein